jgi:hypothetical protein
MRRGDDETASDATTMPVAEGRASRMGWQVLLQLAIFVAALGVAEAILRGVDLRELRDSYQPGRMLLFRYDAELGWAGIPDAASPFTGSRTIDVRNNSLGLRDIEPDAVARSRVLIIGDSFVWGYDVEADERFTELLRRELPGAQIVNAGVLGYGTDQEYLLLKRISSALKPNAVVLIFTNQNDRSENRVNMNDGGYYKPYLVRAPDGAWRFAGQPVPLSRQVYFGDNAVVRHVWLARAAVTGFVGLAHPGIKVPDPTEHLIDMMRELVEARGAKFLVGQQYHEEGLDTFLRARGIPSTAFDGAATYPSDGSHWTPAGHAVVATRLLSLLAVAGIADPAPPHRRQ